MGAVVEDSDDELPDLFTVFEEHASRQSAAVKSDKPVRKGSSEAKNSSAAPTIEMRQTLKSRPSRVEEQKSMENRREPNAGKSYARRRVLNQIHDNPLLRPFDNGRTSAASSTLLQNPSKDVMEPKLDKIEKLRDMTHSKTRTPPPFEDRFEDESSGLSNFIVSDSSYIDEEVSITDLTPPPPRSRRRLVQRGRLLREDSGDGGQNERSGDVPISRTSSRASSSSVGEHRTTEPRCTSKTTEDDSDLDEGLGILRYSPHITRSPSKIKTIKNPSTPPQTPQKPQRSLASPKKAPRIPTTPHRPSMDAFWSQEVINEWNDTYSPKKERNKRVESSEDISLEQNLLIQREKKSPIKKDRAALEAKKTFTLNKHKLAEDFLKELDDTITEGRIFEMATSTGGVKIIWSKKLNTTAGRANWKRETIKDATGAPQKQPGGVTYRHFASIELADKVIDDEHRLLNVIAHEFCHLANFMVSNIKNNPHGKEFKAWAAKCSAIFGHRGIEVTTKHSYSIEYKYIWKCVNCGIEFKRHSKSIDPSRHQCGSCKSKLVQTKPIPRTNAGASEYQMFVKENMKKVMAENPGSPQKDIMGLLAKRYKETKAGKDGSLSQISEVAEQEDETPIVLGEADTDVEAVVKRFDILDLTG